MLARTEAREHNAHSRHAHARTRTHTHAHVHAQTHTHKRAHARTRTNPRKQHNAHTRCVPRASHLKLYLFLGAHPQQSVPPETYDDSAGEHTPLSAQPCQHSPELGPEATSCADAVYLASPSAHVLHTAGHCPAMSAGRHTSTEILHKHASCTLPRPFITPAVFECQHTVPQAFFQLDSAWTRLARRRLRWFQVSLSSSFLRLPPPHL